MNATLSIATQSRGSLALGRLTLRSDWPLGLWRCWSYLHVSRQALVFPAPERDAPALPNQRTLDLNSLGSSSQSGDVAGLREYQPGDSIGSIAWKSAARGLGLLSRTYDNEAHDATTLIDLQSADVAGLEAQLSRLCAWVLKAEQTQTDYAFRLPGFFLELHRGKEQQIQALSALALHANNGYEKP